MKSDNPPKDHHYIPQFMLRHWTNPETGLLQRFTQPVPGKIVVREVPTAAAGFEQHLYAIPGMKPEHAQQLESGFMKQLDDGAARAHALLVENKLNDLTVELKSAWTRFVLSLFLRTPRNLASYKEGYEKLLMTPLPHVTAEYEKRKKLGDPDTYEEYVLKNDPDTVRRLAMTQLPKIMQNEGIGTHIINMQWWTIYPKDASFLISDDPLVISNGIGKKDGHMVLPISPSTLFVATNNRETLNEIVSMGQKEIKRLTNTLIVERATQFVAAQDRRQERFIRNRFGKNRVEGLAQKFSAKY